MIRDCRNTMPATLIEYLSQKKGDAMLIHKSIDCFFIVTAGLSILQLLLRLSWLRRHNRLSFTLADGIVLDLMSSMIAA